MAEWKVFRDILRPYCMGHGLDIGCGNEKITPTCIGVDNEYQYNNHNDPSGRTAANVYCRWEEYLDKTDFMWDFIFSSHLIEDYAAPYVALARWASRVRRGGHIILVLPNDAKYVASVNAVGGTPNASHKTRWSGSADFIQRMNANMKHPEQFEVIVAGDPEASYSFYVVLRKS